MLTEYQVHVYGAKYIGTCTELLSNFVNIYLYLYLSTDYEYLNYLCTYKYRLDTVYEVSMRL